ncbi:hypothetical protein WDW86_01600 [Bdellovibrionota bacterium FG-2]
MNLTDELILLGQMDLAEAKRIRSILEDQGVVFQLRTEVEACNSKGCKPTAQVYTRDADLPVIREFFEKEHVRSLAGLEVNHELQNAVFDSEKSEATCPACGTVFSTLKTECPDCGLCFGGPTG